MTAAAARAAANRRGIACLVGAMACLLLNDTLMKQLGPVLPVAQMVVVRGLMSCAMVLAVLIGLGHARSLPRLLDRRVGARAGADAAGTLLYLASLMHLPLANATAINLAAPLVMALMAAAFLGERVGALRWTAIAAGFGGVLMVIQPQAQGFNAWALVCLAGTVCQALRELLTRRIAPEVPSIAVTLASAVAVTVLAGVVTLAQGWQPLPPGTLGTLALAAALLSAGYYLIVNSMRHGEMSVVAPFRYSALLFAVLLGWLVWGDWPNPLAWGGIALLLATGIYLLHDERRRARAADDAPLA